MIKTVTDDLGDGVLIVTKYRGRVGLRGVEGGHDAAVETCLPGSMESRFQRHWC